MWGIEPDGSLMQLGPLVSGQRHYLPRIPHYQPYWKKIPNYKEKIRQAERLKMLLQEAVEIEAAIRDTLRKPEGELTMADLGKVTSLSFYNEQISDMFVFKELIQLKSLMLQICKISDVSALKELTQLKLLSLSDNPDLTKAQIAELQKALPKCRIRSNPTK